MVREKFRKELLQVLGERGYETSEISSLKINGEKDGIMFQCKSTFSPLIYIEPYYKDWQKGKRVSEIADKLISQLPEVIAAERTLQDIPILPLLREHPEEIKRDLRICMMNRRENKELLAVTPHKIYGDFAAAVYWVLSDNNFRVLMKEELLTKMQRDFDTIFKDAYINMIGEFELQNMEDLLYELMAEQLKNEDMKDIPADIYIKKMCQGIEMYVMTHKSGRMGAAALCYSRELERVEERLGGDYILIPASVDELIFLPFKKNISLEAVNELVQRANEMLEQEERLSDLSYVYVGKEKRLINSLEYMEEIHRQIENTNEAHYRNEQYAREEWGKR